MKKNSDQKKVFEVARLWFKVAHHSLWICDRPIIARRLNWTRFSLPWQIRELMCFRVRRKRGVDENWRKGCPRCFSNRITNYAAMYVPGWI